MHDVLDDLPAGQHDDRTFRARHVAMARTHYACCKANTNQAIINEHVYAGFYHLSVADNPHGFTQTGRQKVGGLW